MVTTFKSHPCVLKTTTRPWISRNLPGIHPLEHPSQLKSQTHPEVALPVNTRDPQGKHRGRRNNTTTPQYRESGLGMSPWSGSRACPAVLAPPASRENCSGGRAGLTWAAEAAGCRYSLGLTAAVAAMLSLELWGQGQGRDQPSSSSSGSPARGSDPPGISQNHPTPSEGRRNRPPGASPSPHGLAVV